MSLQMEKLEHNMAKITIEVPVEEMAKMITQMRGLGMDDLFQGSDCTTNPYKIDKKCMARVYF